MENCFNQPEDRGQDCIAEKWTQLIIYPLLCAPAEATAHSLLALTSAVVRR